MAQGDLKFVIFLPQPLECWDYRHVLPCWAGIAVLCGNAATCVSGLLPVNTSTLSLELGTQQQQQEQQGVSYMDQWSIS